MIVWATSSRVSLPAGDTEVSAARARVSFGDRMPSRSALVSVPERMVSIRFRAFSAFQPWSGVRRAPARR